MFTRLIKPPKESILLLGPRGTGKSTWIRKQCPKSVYYDLLAAKESLKFSKNPSLLYNELSGLKSGEFVVIDEIQKVPALLDEVQRLMEEKRLKFILSGSSARKLKRSGVNLLAGRARLAHMFPLVSAEVNFQFKLLDVLRYGMLPMSFDSNEPAPYLKTYAEVYLQEEIRGEALTRNIGNFGRFLEIAARQNAQITNASNISRDSQVSRQTVQGYFDILVDTLLGFWLWPWKLKRATKQVAHPKFYFFDSGVVRALSGRLPYPPTNEESGSLFETFIIGEIKAYLSYSKKDYEVFFWCSHDKVEVDVLCETAKGYVAIELKSGERWDTRFNRGLMRIMEELGLSKTRSIGVYTGERAMHFGKIEVMPAMKFLRLLWNDEIFR